jgi:hypothetical protein
MATWRRVLAPITLQRYQLTWWCLPPKKYKKDVYNVYKGISKLINLKFGIKKVYI